MRIRRRAQPAQYELVAHALGLLGTALFAMERSEEADAVLEEQLATWRKVFAPDDVRLAAKLENYAENVAEPFGRSQTAAELLKEAAAIREGRRGNASGRQAATLQDLAMREARKGSYATADQQLVHAIDLLRQEIERTPEVEENKAGLAHMQLLRAGLAGVSGDLERAIDLVAEAQAVPLLDRGRAVERDFLVARTISTILEQNGEVAGAITQHERMLDLLAGNYDLLESGTLDPLLLGDVYLSLASLQLGSGKSDAARENLAAAIVQLGRTREVLFVLAEFRRRIGRPRLALAHYQRALRLRKESSTEMLVLFGTNRAVKQPAGPLVFRARAAGDLTLGYTVVRVPGAQFSSTAWLESPAAGARVIGRATNPEPLMFRPDTPIIDGQGFGAKARKAVAAARLYPESALVFIHGYNVRFEAALKRGAQLVRDLNFDGAAFVFAWPSQGLFSAYHIDRMAAQRSAAALADFLEQVRQASGAKKIHVIAHSMGNRVALGGLVAAVSRKGSTLQASIGEVILAAPAVPVPEFIEWLDELQRHGVNRVTLYASAGDRALMVGRLAELTVLAGFVDKEQPVLHPNLQSIDITKSGGMNSLDHDVFASNPVMMEDIRQLLQTGVRPPHERSAQLVAQPSKSDVRYWQYVPAESHPTA